MKTGHLRLQDDGTTEALEALRPIALCALSTPLIDAAEYLNVLADRLEELGLIEAKDSHSSFDEGVRIQLSRLRLLRDARRWAQIIVRALDPVPEADEVEFVAEFVPAVRKMKQSAVYGPNPVGPNPPFDKSQ